MNSTGALWRTNSPSPTIVGTGLLALDVIINEDESSPPRIKAGGSCGNVIAILSYLGWQAYPIARVGNDVSAEILKNDLRRFGVRLRHVLGEPSTGTPIVVEKIISHSNASRTHRFLFTCPHCGSRLPRYAPVLLKQADRISPTLPKASVFYFDRLSRGALRLAEKFAKRESLVMFEPIGKRRKSLFGEGLGLCHILKYANDSHIDLREFNDCPMPPLVIETMGAKGLRFRYRKKDGTSSKWLFLKAYPIEELKDTAGAGDWCTAGLLHVLGQGGRRGLSEASKGSLTRALNFGQALASLKCRFESPRGLMYSLTKERLRENVEEIMTKGSSTRQLQDMIPKDSEETPITYDICSIHPRPARD